MKIAICIVALLLWGLAPIDAQIQLYNDEFDETGSLINWQNINDVEGWDIVQLESYNIDDSIPGSMFMKPFTVSWFGEWRGALLFKEISGDFVVSTRITATARDHVSIPSSDFSLAGIMIRTPIHYPTDGPTDWVEDEQNYVFMSIGQASGTGPHFEIKTTCHSTSMLDYPQISVQTSEVRMARIGQVIIVLARFPGEEWHVRGRFNRNDGSCSAPFPNTVQLGMVTYTDWPNVETVGADFHNNHTLHSDSLGPMEPYSALNFSPDLIGQFDYMRFDSVVVPPQLSGLDLWDESEVSEQELLSFLGYDSESYCPENNTVHSIILNSWTTTQGTQINANNSIMGNSQVYYRAQNEINLLPGFEISSQAVFRAVIGSCTE